MTTTADVTITDLATTTPDGARLTVAIHHPAHIDPHDTSATTTPLIVLAHGWGATHTVWHATARLLAAQGHTVAAYDQRGHGTSTLGSNALTIQQLGHDLATVADALAPHRPVVVAGHSGGGYAALAYATQLYADAPRTAPQRLVGLLLAASAADDQQTPPGELRIMKTKAFQRALRNPRLGRQLLKKTLHPNTPAHTQETNRRLFANTDPHTRLTAFASTSTMDHTPHLRHITTPTTILRGTHDTSVGQSHIRTLQTHLPNTTVDTLSDAGHILPLEAPHQLARQIHQLTLTSQR
ncbi:alpha/beta hydrolase [Kitasatospora sp. NPDC056731]|uniref:alpha/beta fold hydrolase n=1 Tax=Kitasatospora sp. NPDC056731 TaxID=3155422 RepID=UPI00343C5789